MCPHAPKRRSELHQIVYQISECSRIPSLYFSIFVLGKEEYDIYFVFCREREPEALLHPLLHSLIFSLFSVLFGFHFRCSFKSMALSIFT